MGVNSLPKIVTRQRRDCDLNPCPSEPESSTLTTRLPSHPVADLNVVNSAVEQSRDRAGRVTKISAGSIFAGNVLSGAKSPRANVQYPG